MSYLSITPTESKKPTPPPPKIFYMRHRSDGDLDISIENLSESASRAIQRAVRAMVKALQ